MAGGLSFFSDDFGYFRDRLAKTVIDDVIIIMAAFPHFPFGVIQADFQVGFLFASSAFQPLPEHQKRGRLQEDQYGFSVAGLDGLSTLYIDYE